MAEIPPKKSKNEILYFYGTLVFAALLISLGGLLYRNGYRLQSFNIVRAGSLEVSVYEAGSKIYIDNILQNTTNASEETITFKNLSPKRHTVTVLKNGFHVWEKSLSIETDKTAKVSSFLAPLHFTIEKITDSEEIKGLVPIFAKIAPPKDVMERAGDLAVWIENTSLFGGYFCEAPRKCQNSAGEILKTEENIKNVTFYKERGDVLVFSHGKNIEEMEINSQEKQNVHILYSGTDPIFFKLAGDTLYIKDGKEYFKLKM